jgi:hypothetical protein
MICLSPKAIGSLALLAVLVVSLLAAILILIATRQTRPQIRCGSTGPKGDQGPKGPEGAKGIGETGPFGPSGATGATGVAGSHGGGDGGTLGMILMNSNTNNIADGNIIGQGYVATTANEFMASYVMTSNVTLQNLIVNVTTVPGGGNARTFTVRVNGVDSSLTATIANFVTTASNTINFVTVLAGDRVSLRTTSLNTPMPSPCEASIEYT